MEIKHGRVETIDVFRGFAILLVALFHFTARLPPESLNVSGIPAPAVFFGWIGVYFFFVISGYCIFLTLERAPDIRHFLARRFSRIYPAYLAAVILLYVYVALVYVPIVEAANYRTRIPDFVGLLFNLIFMGEAKGWVNGSFWSVAVEVKFYLMVGVLLFFVPQRDRFARLFTVCGVAGALIWALFALGLLEFAQDKMIAKALSTVVIAPFLPFFAIGVLGRMSERKAMATAWPLALSILSAMMIVYVKSVVEFAASPLEAVETMLMFALLVWLFLRFVSGKPLPHVPLLSPSLAFAGFLSYSWYLLHEPLGFSFLYQLNLLMPPLLAIAVTLAATLLAGWLFAQIFEWRFRKPFERGALKILNLMIRHGPDRIFMRKEALDLRERER